MKDVIKSIIFSFVILMANNVSAFLYNDFYVNVGVCDPNVPYNNTLFPDPACSVLMSSCQGYISVYDITCPDVPVPDGTSMYQNVVTDSAIFQDVLVSDVELGARELATQQIAGLTLPDCAPGYVRGEIGDGYLYITTGGSDAAHVDLKLDIYKRTICSPIAGATLQPLGIIGSGGTGSGSTDMTATNNLISTSNTSLDGINTGVQGVNTSITDGLATTNSKLDQLIAKPNGGTGETFGPYTGGDGSGSVAYNNDAIAGKFSFVSEKFNQFKNDALATPFISNVQGFFQLPSGGDSTYSFNAGIYGQHDFDWSQYSSVFVVLKSIILVITSYGCVRILILKGV